MQNQVGIIVVKDGRVVGVEAFDHPETFKQHEKDIYQKYALDIASKGKTTESPVNAVAKLEEELEKGKITREDTFNIGGENLYIETGQLRGTLFRRGAKPIYISIVLSLIHI